MELAEGLPADLEAPGRSLNLSDFIKPPTGLGCLCSGPLQSPAQLHQFSLPPRNVPRNYRWIVSSLEPFHRVAAPMVKITERAQEKTSLSRCG